MNDAILTQLKIIVERAVRPVRAGMTRKFKMREELLAHVSSVFEVEHAQLGDEQVALERTALRFGNPAEVTSQLQASLSINERVGGFVERLVLAPDLSPARRALRHANFFLAIMLAVLAVPIVSLPFTAKHVMYSAVLVLIYVHAQVWGITFASSLLVQKVSQAVHGPAEQFRPRVFMLAFISALAGPIGMLAYFGLSVAVTGDDEFGFREGLPVSWSMMLLLPLCVIFFASMLRRVYDGPTNGPYLQTFVKAIFRYLAASIGAFAIALLTTQDLMYGLKEGLVFFAILAVCLLFWDLVLTRPHIVAALRSERSSKEEWANLRIN